jgi:hypothetical protein
MVTLIADAYIGSNSRGAWGTASWAFLHFWVTQGAKVTALRVYYPVQQGGAGGKPDLLRLFDSDGATALASFDLSGVTSWPNGGWLERTLPEPLEVEAGRHLTAGYRFPADMGIGFQSSSAPLSEVAGGSWIVGGSPAGVVGSYSAVLALSSGETPAGVPAWANDHRDGVDARLETLAPATPPDVEVGLADWLDVEVGAQPQSAPLLTHAEVTHASHGLAVLGELIGDVLDDTAGLLARVPDTLAATLTAVKDAVTIGPLPGIAGLETLANNILTALETAAQYLANPLGGSLGALRNTPAVPGSGWTLIDTVTFTFQRAWDVPADLYVLTSSNYPPNVPLQDVDGAPWRPRAGWWAVRNGDAFLGRQFVDWDVQHLVDGGRRMPGVVVRLQPGVEATLEAWRLT